MRKCLYFSFILVSALCSKCFQQKLIIYLLVKNHWFKLNIDHRQILNFKFNFFYFNNWDRSGIWYPVTSLTSNKKIFSGLIHFTVALIDIFTKGTRVRVGFKTWNFFKKIILQKIYFYFQHTLSVRSKKLMIDDDEINVLKLFFCDGSCWKIVLRV